MTVRLRAALSDRRILEGPVQGNGGKLGNATLHVRYEAAGEAAIRSLGVATRMAAKGRPTGLYEPEPGHVAIYPQYSAESDGEPVVVPLAGTRWEVVSPFGSVRGLAEFREAHLDFLEGTRAHSPSVWDLSAAERARAVNWIRSLNDARGIDPNAPLPEGFRPLVK